MIWSDTFSSGQYIIHFLSEEKITVQNSLFSKFHNAFNINGFSVYPVAAMETALQTLK